MKRIFLTVVTSRLAGALHGFFFRVGFFFCGVVFFCGGFFTYARAPARAQAGPLARLASLWLRVG